jgi:GT2 family glycosyltransferase
MTRLSRLFPQSTRFNAYNLGYLPEDEVYPVDSVVGAYMQVRAEAIRRVGLLDESYFMYGEDLDWAKRIKTAGWEVWYNGEVEVTHVKEASSRKSRKARLAFYEAMWIFYRKHYRADSSWALDKLIWLGIALIGGVDIAIRLWKLRQERI